MDKNIIYRFIDENCEDMIALSHFIYDHPETGMKEFQAAERIEGALAGWGFSVEKGVGGMETAFRAVYEKGTGGPSIGLLCEYDALEGIGHACGHHMQAPAVLLAARSLKECCPSENFKVVVYGTPAEESYGGKNIMAREGCFQDIDAALMFHGMTATIVDVRSYAMREFSIEFFGKSAHAALFPYEGRSALDALLLAAHGVEFLREHVKDDSRMHYTINESGGPANVVSDYAKGSFVIRSYSMKDLEDMDRRLRKIAEGAAMMTETECKVTQLEEFMPKVPVFKLNDLLMEHAREVGAPNIQPPITQSGSTDFATVMYMVPGSVIRVAFAPEGAGVHSKEFLAAGKTENADRAIVYAAKILAQTSCDLICDEKLMEEIQREFRENKEKMES